MSEQQSTATEPIQNDTNGSHAGTSIEREREMLAYRSIIKECLKFNGKNAQGIVYTIILLFEEILCNHLLCHCNNCCKRGLEVTSANAIMLFITIHKL